MLGVWLWHEAESVGWGCELCCDKLVASSIGEVCVGIVVS